MKKFIEYMRRRKRAFLIGSIGICTALILLGAFYYSQVHVSETVVRRYMKQASLKLNDAEIKMLSKNLSTEIDDKIQAAEAEGISEEEMRSILQAVNKQLSHATYELSAEEITKISNDILKEVVNNYTPDPEQYKDMIDKLSEEISELEKNSYSKDQIREIASELDLTERDIIEIMNEAMLTDGALSDLADELDLSVEELTKLIAENRKYTDSLYVQLGALLDLEPAELKQLMENMQNSSKQYTYLANKLGVTEEKLYAEIAKCKALSDEEIAGIAEQLNLSSSEFQKKLEDNLQVTEDKLQSLAYGMNVDIAKLEQVISENKASAEQSIGELEKATYNNSSKISSLELAKDALENTDSSLLAISEALQAADKALEETSESNLNEALSKISSVVGALPEGSTVASQLLDAQNALNDAKIELVQAIEEGNEEAVKTARISASEALSAARNEIETSMETVIGNIPDDTTIAELFNGVDTDIAGVKTELENASNNLQTAKAELEAAVLSGKEDAIKTAEEKLTTAKSELNTVISNAQTALQSDIEAVDLQMEALNNAITQANSKIQTAETNISNLQSELEDTKTAISDAISSKVSKDELDELKDEMAMKAELKYSNDNGVPTIILSGVVEE